MEINLESNRKFLFKIFVPLFTLFNVALIGLFVSCLMDRAVFRYLTSLIIFVIIDVIFILIFIFICKKRKPQYTFNSEKILYIKRNTEKEIKISNIKSMTYIKPKWYYWFLILFAFLLGDSGSFLLPVIDVVEKDGTEHQLGYFSKKEIESLKTLYGSLLNVK